MKPLFGKVGVFGVGLLRGSVALRIKERVTAEVNEDPPNPESMAFHGKLGFRHLFSRKSPRLGKVVAMLERPL